MITVSIVAYNTPDDELARCLASLDSPLVARVYIVDNSRNDATRRLCQRYPSVEYIPSDNVGYGAGHNTAIRRIADPAVDYHLVLNSDVYFQPDILATLADYMDANPDVGQLQPDIVYPDGSRQYTCRLLPWPLVLFGRRFLPKSLIRKADDRYTLRFADHYREMNIPYHQGSFMLFRLISFREAGGFDERFFMYPEDIDITRRIHRRWRTMFVPLATVVHAHRAASYKSPRMLAIHLVNMTRYFNKWGWIFDRERRQWNSDLLRQLGYYDKRNSRKKCDKKA